MEIIAYPYGQHPRAKNRQQNLLFVASALVYPASLAMTQRDCDNVLLQISSGPCRPDTQAYLARASSLSPPAHLLYQKSKRQYMQIKGMRMGDILYSFPGWIASVLSISPASTCFRAGLSFRFGCAVATSFDAIVNECVGEDNRIE